MAQKIVTLTMNPALDKSISIDNVVPERKLRCSSPSWQAGGGGINVARVAHRLGGDVVALYPAGGPLGQMFQELLQEEDLAQRPFSIQGLTRESLAVLEKATKQQYRFSTPGPELSEEEWQRCFQALQEMAPAPDYVVLSGGLPPGVPRDFYAWVANEAAQQGYRVIVDTSGEPLRRAGEAGVFLLKPNLRELRQLTQQDLENGEEQEAAVMQLIEEEKCQVIVLSLGAAGALLATKEGSRRLRAPTVTIRSKVGAGDSMVGGIVWSLAEGRSVTEAAQFGVAAGAATVMTPGTELCHRQDAQELYERIKTASG